MNKIAKIFLRFCFLGLLIFEFLNWFEILHFNLDFTWLGLIITASGAWLGLEIISWRLRRAIEEGLSYWVFLLVLVLLILDVTGDINFYYTNFSWFDQVGHFLGGCTAGAIMINIYNKLASKGKIVMGQWGRFISAVGLAVLLAVFYELEEYLEDFFTGSSRLGSGPDTANDLMLGFFGACLVCFIRIMLVKIKRKK